MKTKLIEKLAELRSKYMQEYFELDKTYDFEVIGDYTEKADEYENIIRGIELSIEALNEEETK